MAPVPHNWTVFEKYTLLCLLSRGIHIKGLPASDLEELANATASTKKHRNTPTKPRKADTTARHGYIDVATALNHAVHRGDYKNDIPLKEVTAMIDKMLGEKKAAKGFMERNSFGRITRATKRVWERGIKFDGSKYEWEHGRKEAEEQRMKDMEERRMNTGFAIMTGIEVDISGIGAGWGGESMNVDNSQAVDAWSSEVATATQQNAEIDPWGSEAATATQNDTQINTWDSDVATVPQRDTQADTWGYDIATAPQREIQIDSWDSEVVAPAHKKEAESGSWGNATKQTTDTPQDSGMMKIGTSREKPFEPVASRDEWGGAITVNSSAPISNSWDDTASGQDPWGAGGQNITFDNETLSELVDPWAMAAPANAADTSLSEPLISAIDIVDQIDSVFDMPLGTSIVNSDSMSMNQAAINPERLVMLATSTYEDQDIRSTVPGRESPLPKYKGSNANPLPFNRLEQMRNA